MFGGGTKWVPGGIDIRENTYTRTRKGGALAAQWRSPDESLLATLQYNRSEYQNDWEEYSLSAGLGNSQTAQDLVLTAPGRCPPSAHRRMNSTAMASSCAASSTRIRTSGPAPTRRARASEWLQRIGRTLPICSGIATPGTATAARRPRPTLGADTRSSTQTNVTEDLSMNLRWDVTERLGLNFDVQRSSPRSKTSTTARRPDRADLFLDISKGKP
jgi:hypothetical protein